MIRKLEFERVVQDSPERGSLLSDALRSETDVSDNKYSSIKAITKLVFKRHDCQRRFQFNLKLQTTVKFSNGKSLKNLDFQAQDETRHRGVSAVSRGATTELRRPNHRHHPYDKQSSSFPNKPSSAPFSMSGQRTVVREVDEDMAGAWR